MRNRNSKKNRLNNNQGFALILCMWITAILSILLGTIQMMVRASVSLAKYESESSKGFLMARGGFLRMVHAIARNADDIDNKQKLVNIRGEWIGQWLVNPTDWSFKKLELKNDNQTINLAINSEEPYIICQISAEDGKFPLNWLNDQIIMKLPDMTPVIAESIKAALKESRDNKRFFHTVEELLLINDLPKEMYAGDEKTPGLKDILTTFSDGRVFVNGANEAVMTLIPGIDHDIAKELNEQIRKKPIEHIEELQHVIGATPQIYKSMKSWMTVIPSYYCIQATAYLGKLKKNVEGILFIKFSQQNQFELKKISGW